jgi:hypothetical protein
MDQRQMAQLTPELQAATALKHLLTRIRDDERVAYLMGEGSQTFNLATEAYASLIGADLAELRQLVAGSKPPNVGGNRLAPTQEQR